MVIPNWAWTAPRASTAYRSVARRTRAVPERSMAGPVLAVSAGANPATVSMAAIALDTTRTIRWRCRRRHPRRRRQPPAPERRGWRRSARWTDWRRSASPWRRRRGCRPHRPLARPRHYRWPVSTGQSRAWMAAVEPAAAFWLVTWSTAAAVAYLKYPYDSAVLRPHLVRRNSGSNPLGARGCLRH